MAFHFVMCIKLMYINSHVKYDNEDTIEFIRLFTDPLRTHMRLQRQNVTNPEI